MCVNSLFPKMTVYSLYTVSKDELVQTSLPKAPTLLEFARYGLANVDSNLAFMRSWGPAQMFVFLREKLPHVFQYLAYDYPWINDIDEDDDDELQKHEPPLLLLYPNRRQFSMATTDHATGISCFESKGRKSGGPNDSSIWLST